MQKKLLTQFNPIYDKKKTPQKMGTEGTYLNIIKVIHYKHSKPYSKQ